MKVILLPYYFLLLGFKIGTLLISYKCFLFLKKERKEIKIAPFHFSLSTFDFHVSFKSLSNIFLTTLFFHLFWTLPSLPLSRDCSSEPSCKYFSASCFSPLGIVLPSAFICLLCLYSPVFPSLSSFHPLLWSFSTHSSTLACFLQISPFLPVFDAVCLKRRKTF